MAFILGIIIALLVYTIVGLYQIWTADRPTWLKAVSIASIIGQIVLMFVLALK